MPSGSNGRRPQEFLEGPAHGTLGQHAQHDGTGVVAPDPAGLLHQGQGGEASDPFVGSKW